MTKTESRLSLKRFVRSGNELQLFYFLKKNFNKSSNMCLYRLVYKKNAVFIKYSYYYVVFKINSYLFSKSFSESVLVIMYLHYTIPKE